MFGTPRAALPRFLCDRDVLSGFLVAGSAIRNDVNGTRWTSSLDRLHSCAERPTYCLQSRGGVDFYFYYYQGWVYARFSMVFVFLDPSYPGVADDYPTACSLPSRSRRYILNSCGAPGVSRCWSGDL